jgi:chorismate mutase
MSETPPARTILLSAIVSFSLVTTAGVGTVSAAPQELTIRVANGETVTAATNEPVAVPILVESAPDGLANVEGVNVSVGNTSVATVATPPLDNGSSDFPADRLVVRSRGPGYVNFSARALTNDTAPGPGTEILVGTVLLNTTTTTGTASLSVDVVRGNNESAFSLADSEVTFTTVDGAVNVTEPSPTQLDVRLGTGTGNATGVANGTVEVPVIVDRAPDGLAAVTGVNVSVANESLATVAGTALNDSTTAFPASRLRIESQGTDYVNFSVDATDNASAPGGPEEPAANSDDVVVGTVVLRTADAAGTTTLDLRVVGGRTQSIFSSSSLAEASSEIAFTAAARNLTVETPLTPTPAALEMRVTDDGTVDAATNDTVAVPILVESAPDGLARVQGVNVSVGNASVATVAATPLDNASSEFPASGVKLESQGPGYVNFSASALSNTTAPGGPEEPATNSRDVLVGTVLLNTTGATGTASLSIDVVRGRNQSVFSQSPGARSNSLVTFTTVDGAVNVTEPSPTRLDVRLGTGTGNATGVANGTVEVPVIVDRASDGLASVTGVNVSVANESLATVAATALNDSATAFPASRLRIESQGTDYVNFSVDVTDNASAPGGPEEPVANSDDVVVGTVVLNATGALGTTTLDLRVAGGRTQSVFSPSSLAQEGSEIDFTETGTNLTLEPAPTPGGLEMRVRDGGRVWASTNDTVEVPVVVPSAPNGLARVEDVTVTVANTSVATIAATPLNNSSGEFPPNTIDVRTRSRRSVTFSASAFSNTTAPGGPEEPPANSLDVVVGTVVLNTTGSTGTTAIDVDVARGYNQSVLSSSKRARSNSEVGFATTGATLETRDNPFPNGVPGTGSVPPNDVLARPGYEDVDGDGRFGFLDVVELLFALDEIGNADLTPRQVAALDFDGTGKIGFLDVVELLFAL